MEKTEVFEVIYNDFCQMLGTKEIQGEIPDEIYKELAAKYKMEDVWESLKLSIIERDYTGKTPKSLL